jgi:hypothetical protein
VPRLREVEFGGQRRAEHELHQHVEVRWYRGEQETTVNSHTKAVLTCPVLGGGGQLPV